MNHMRQGYTLLEMLIVISIIAIISTAGLLSYQATLKSSRDARRRTELEQIRGALELYRSNNNTYPASIATDCSASGGLTDGGGNTYLSTVPHDPKCTSQTYYYTQLSSGADYTLGASLEIPSTSSCGDCSAAVGTQLCNYCLGPYGQK